MDSARKMAEEALAAIDAAIGDADETTPERVSLAALGPALCDLIRATRALLAAEPAKGACADCGGLGWIPAGDEQLGCIACNGKGTIEPAPPADARRMAEERVRYLLATLDRWDAPYRPLMLNVDADDLRALLAAGPEEKAPGHDRIAELESLLRECNAVCLCGCPDSEHEADECGESCGHDDHECLRVAPAVLEIVQRYRVALSDALRAQTTPPPSDAVREAAEVIRTILTAHDARLSESGVLTYGPPSKGTGFVAAIQWLRRYDAARGGE